MGIGKTRSPFFEGSARAFPIAHLLSEHLLYLRLHAYARDKLRKSADEQEFDPMALWPSPPEFPPGANPALGFRCIPIGGEVPVVPMGASS